MKFSYQWLAELVPGLTLRPSELERLITMKTAECEGVEAVGGHFASVQAVKVVAVEPLPKGKNRRVIIETSGGERQQVVCGAPNVRPGITAVWAPPATVLNGKTIAHATIEGVASEGMLASAEELGINRGHTGILELGASSDLAALRPDWIIEIDNKSLTHRPDLWGHHGMAREVAAIGDGWLKDPVDLTLLPVGDGPVRVEILDDDLCPRYSALRVEDIQVGPAPLWLQARLESIGLNGISNIVDLTNYILAELPQPMHAFDADKLRGGTIFVRRALAGEKLAALNGETYSLVTADLVIADAAGPIALAGVIGGSASAISAATTRVIFESANFQAASVRLSSARHKLRTDASMRFEKALDPENTVRGLARAVALLKELSPTARVIGGVSDRRAECSKAPTIQLPVGFVSRKLGKAVSREEIDRILTSLGFGVVEPEPGVLTVTVPSWRATKDISLKDDLVEEIGRIIGYAEIVPTAPLVASTVPPADPAHAYVRQLRTQLSAQGFSEVSNYSFVSEAEIAALSLDIKKHIGVRNPIAAEQTHLRTSLLAGLLRNIAGNVRHFRDFRIFEIGNEIHPQAGNALPIEVPHVAAVIFNQHGTEDDFFEAKRVLECLFPRTRVAATDARPYEHPVRAATVEWHGSIIGRIFELHPSVLQQVGVQGRADIFDFDLDLAQAIAGVQTIRYRPLRRYPTSGFDLSIIAPLQNPVAAIEDELQALGGSQIALIDFVRQYSGPPLAEGTKSVSYHIEVGAPDRTLTADEAGEIRNALIEGMRARGYELRI
jgi:phenylalanyl-tRNA synthetase beta chain